MNRYFLLFYVVIFVSLECSAQQDPQFSQYMFNNLVINPAYAGYKENLNVSAVYRNQWVGVEGSPKTQTFIVDGSVANDKVGLALGIINDKYGLRGKFTGYLNYSYKLPVGEEGVLALGLAGGISQYTYDSDKATYEEEQEVGFLNGRYSYIDPEARFGVHYSTDRFFVGFSATSLFSQMLSSDKPIREIVTNQNAHFFLSAGYLFDINEYLKFKPTILVKEDVKGPTGIDGNLNFLIMDRVWIGGSYRSNLDLWKKNIGNKINGSAIVGMLQFVNDTWNIGYSYDYSTSSLKNFNSTHEISVGFVLSRNRDLKILNPRYF